MGAAEPRRRAQGRRRSLALTGPQQTEPVARVLPLLGLPQLDKTFDYLVPEKMDADAQPGVRVRIRFAGRLVDGIVIARSAETDHPGNLAYLKSVISPEVVYPPQLGVLVDSLAELYGGVRSDIIRSAVPGRHARVEKGRGEAPAWRELGPLELSDVPLDNWSTYAWGESFVAAVRSGAPARAAWHPAPGDPMLRRIAELAVNVARDGGGALIVLPDQRRVDALEAELRTMVSARQITVLTADLGPESRYRRYLDVIHGSAKLVIGTRSAAYAPVQDLRLAVLVDDADDNLVDPRAPYIHARDILTARSAFEHCALLFASWSRSAEVQQLVARGWAATLVPTPEHLAEQMPTMTASADTSVDAEDTSRTRLPAIAFRAARQALRDGTPVLVQVPRKGYQPSLSCRDCGTPARCRACNGPLEIRSDEAPSCRWCGRVEPRHRCQTCGSMKIRAVVTGSDRTAEELGRTFAPHPVRSSSGEKILDRIEPGARVVVATPGAEPDVDGGYGAVLLLDTWAMLGRQDLRATEDALAAWASAAAKASGSGSVVIDADAAIPTVRSFIHWDIVGAAETELAERGAVRFPPVAQMAAIDGTPDAISRFTEELELPAGADVLGPVELPQGVRPPAGMEAPEVRRLLVRVPRNEARELGKALRAAAATRAMAREERPVRIMVDPVRVG